MDKFKIVFQETLMISTGILFVIGAEGLAAHLMGQDFELVWYDPLAIILVGFLCALPTLLLMSAWEEEDGKISFKMRVFLHCVTTFAIVSVAGRIFCWYSSLMQYLILVIMYFAVYIFVWTASIWYYKAEENKINHALESMQDEE